MNLKPTPAPAPAPAIAAPRRWRRQLPLAAAALALACAAVCAPAAAQERSTLSSFAPAVYADGLLRQYLVKNGRIYLRTEPNWNDWQNISAAFNGSRLVGSGEITAFDAERYSDGLLRQFLTRGGHVYRRIQAGVDNWHAWENIDSAFPGTGDARITSFSVAVYPDGLQRQFLVRGGSLYRRTQTAAGGWPAWEDISAVVHAACGSESPITSFHSAPYQDGKLRQFVVCGNQVLRRTEPNWNTWENVSGLFAGVGRSADPRVDEPIHKRVMVIEYNPTIEYRLSGERIDLPLNRAMGWRDPRVLEQQYIEFLEQASEQVVQYTVAEHLRLDAFPPRTRNPVYDDESYQRCMADRPHSCPREEDFDYVAALREHGVCERANRYEIDELWLWGGPYFGFWEANMTGPGAFDTNGAPIPHTLTGCNVKLNIMGFNYEREPERMLEDMGHRVEGTMEHRFGQWRNTYGPPPQQAIPGPNPLERFTMRGFDVGTAACGNIHGSLNTPVFDPNNWWGYDFTNPHREPNTCDDWERYPDLTGAVTVDNCSKWGGPRCSFPDGYAAADRGWHLYWLGKIPNFVGSYGGAHNDWWWYVLDWDAAAATPPGR
ncbi:hypothetical protein K4L06_08105 [Lysobacter sp. BMK333-48F3]|uniref:hypothetical protein n=1 Tax=Lysobacter sp. BMK333-48F3 TaxID=2867962 RepID=UPI001C8C20BA|nr:hypothetical protein [Lysobacter sp. BMK333-48F3]MBX9401275.1 hypothetical protein [Lysobacter sp. BMK333-48F3]